MAKIFLLVVVTIIKSDCLKINLALNKRAYLSSVYLDYSARYGVDGNISYESFAHADTIPKDAWFVVDLGRPYQIEYVVLYHRKECFGCRDCMDNFVVGLLNDFDPSINRTWRDHYTICAKCNRTLKLGERVELECADTREYYRYVIVQQEEGKIYLTLRELEVFGNYTNYIGCFKELENMITIGSGVSLAECMNECERLNKSLAGIQAGTTCSCGNGTKGYLPLHTCGSLCLESNDPCGGENWLSAYEIYPMKIRHGINRKYIGCFMDKVNDRDFTVGPFIDKLMTIGFCEKYCTERNYLFFGLQFGEECFCGNNYGKHDITKEWFCTKPCSSNRYEICGDSNRNSIYSIDGGWNFFKYNHHCKDGVNLDLDGICENRQCRDGWTGDSCSTRNCSTNNGDCGIHKCQQASIFSEVVSECLCNPGYDKTSWWEYCYDIEECGEEIDACDENITNCVNTEGGFRCQCMNGYESADDKTCKDVDECQSPTNKCNQLTENCINTIGSYVCKCKNGFITINNDFHCKDVNECYNSTDKCNLEVANCFNVIGSYSCNCLEKGFIYDYKHHICLDIDECQTSINHCNQSTTTCINVIGSYACKCKNGFKIKNDFECLDIDECLDTPDICNLNVANCSNTFGSYECHCLQNGYTYDTNSHTCHASNFMAQLVIISCVFIAILIVIIFAIAIHFKRSINRRVNTSKAGNTENTIVTYKRIYEGINLDASSLSLNKEKSFLESNHDTLF